jgi:hypothetical protein
MEPVSMIFPNEVVSRSSAPCNIVCSWAVLSGTAPNRAVSCSTLPSRAFHARTVIINVPNRPVPVELFLTGLAQQSYSCRVLSRKTASSR